MTHIEEIAVGEVWLYFDLPNYTTVLKTNALKFEVGIRARDFITVQQINV
jgi:hypothetical protein